MHPALVGLITLGAMFSLAVLFLLVNDRFAEWRHRDRRSPEQRALDATALADRLMSPRWEDVARITGGSPSAALLDLYSDSRLLAREDFWVRTRSSTGEPEEERIAGFLPADAVTLEHPWYANLPKGSFPFATDISGDFLFVGLTHDARDQPVKHWYHDGGDVEVIAPSLATFVQSCREAGTTDG